MLPKSTRYAISIDRDINENMLLQFTTIFEAVKFENFYLIFFYIFLIFAQNIDCGYTLEPPREGGSNEYTQCMFYSKNKKNRYTKYHCTVATLSMVNRSR